MFTKCMLVKVFILILSALYQHVLNWFSLNKVFTDKDIIFFPIDCNEKTSHFVSVILGKSHYLLYSLVAAMQPRMLVTFDEELRPLPVAVRVGQVGHYVKIPMQ